MDPDEYRRDASAALTAVWNDLRAEADAAKEQLNKFPIDVRAKSRAFCVTAKHVLLVEPLEGRLLFNREESRSTINNFISEVWWDPAVVLRAIRRMESAVRWLRRVVAAAERDWLVYVERHAKALREIKAQAAKCALQGG